MNEDRNKKMGFTLLEKIAIVVIVILVIIIFFLIFNEEIKEYIAFFKELSSIT